MALSSRYLVVEDDPLYSRSLARFLRRFGEVSVAGTVARALEAIERDRTWAGVTLDVELPDGRGLQVLTQMRERGLQTPTLVLTGLRDDEVIRTAQLHGATYMFKPASNDSLRAFVTFCERSSHASRALQGVVARVAESCALSRREREVLLLTASGLTREAIAQHLGLGGNTISTYARRVVAKTAAPSWRALIRELHRSVFAP